MAWAPMKAPCPFCRYRTHMVCFSNWHGVGICGRTLQEGAREVALVNVLLQKGERNDKLEVGA